MYHPAAALHQGNLRKVLEADMWKLRELLESVKDQANQENLGGDLTEPEQLKMM